MIFNDFIKDDFIPEGDCQVVSGSVSLPDPVVFAHKFSTRWVVGVVN